MLIHSSSEYPQKIKDYVCMYICTKCTQHIIHSSTCPTACLTDTCVAVTGVADTGVLTPHVLQEQGEGVRDIVHVVRDQRQFDVISLLLVNEVTLTTCCKCNNCIPKTMCLPSSLVPRLSLTRAVDV